MWYPTVEAGIHIFYRFMLDLIHCVDTVGVRLLDRKVVQDCNWNSGCNVWSHC